MGERESRLPSGTGSGLSLSTSTNRIGWVLAGGVETHLWGGWTGKLEYFYMLPRLISARRATKHEQDHYFTQNSQDEA